MSVALIEVEVGKSLSLYIGGIDSESTYEQEVMIVEGGPAIVAVTMAVKAMAVVSMSLAIVVRSQM